MSIAVAPVGVMPLSAESQSQFKSGRRPPKKRRLTSLADRANLPEPR